MKFFYRLWWILVYPVFHIMYRIRTRGRENIPSGAALICSNHSSLSDPVLIAYAFGFKYFLRFMAKIELMRTPILGYLLKIAGIIGVDRGNSDVKAVKTSLKSLKDGMKVVIFPEGRRVAADEEAAAKTGAIMLASKTGAPLVPVYIPRDKKLFHTVHIEIGKPYFIDKIKGNSEVYSVYANELMQKIEALKHETYSG